MKKLALIFALLLSMQAARAESKHYKLYHYCVFWPVRIICGITAPFHIFGWYAAGIYDGYLKDQPSQPEDLLPGRWMLLTPLDPDSAS